MKLTWQYDCTVLFLWNRKKTPKSTTPSTDESTPETAETPDTAEKREAIDTPEKAKAPEPPKAPEMPKAPEVAKAPKMTGGENPAISR